MLFEVAALIVCYGMGAIVAHIRSIHRPRDWSREDD